MPKPVHLPPHLVASCCLLPLLLLSSILCSARCQHVNTAPEAQLSLGSLRSGSGCPGGGSLLHSVSLGAAGNAQFALLDARYRFGAQAWLGAGVLGVGRALDHNGKAGFARRLPVLKTFSGLHWAPLLGDSFWPSGLPPPDPMLDLAWLLAATAPEGSCRVGHHLGVPQCCAVCALVGGAVVAAGYHGDEEARAQGSLWPATGNCTGSWRQTM